MESRYNGVRLRDIRTPRHARVTRILTLSTRAIHTPRKSCCRLCTRNCANWQRSGSPLRNLGRRYKPTALVHEAYLCLVDVDTRTALGK